MLFFPTLCADQQYDDSICTVSTYVNQFHEIFHVFTGKIRGKPTNKGEDDGYLMDLVYHPETHSSSYVVIDAKTMKEVFIVPLPQRIPFGVHGIWFDKQYLDQTNS